MQRNGGYIGARRGYQKLSANALPNWRNQEGVFDLYDQYAIRKGETDYYSGDVGPSNLTPAIHTFQKTPNANFPQFDTDPQNSNATNIWRYLFLRRELNPYRGCMARLVFRYVPGGYWRGDFQMANMSYGDAIHFTTKTQGPDTSYDPNDTRLLEIEPYNKIFFGHYIYTQANTWNNARLNPYYDETGDLGWQRNSNAGNTGTDYSAVSWENINESFSSLTNGKWNADIGGTGSSQTGLNWYWYVGSGNYHFKWYLYTEVTSNFSTDKVYWLRSPPAYFGQYPYFFTRYAVYGSHIGTCTIHLEIINRGENIAYT